MMNGIRHTLEISPVMVVSLHKSKLEKEAGAIRKVKNGMMNGIGSTLEISSLILMVVSLPRLNVMVMNSRKSSVKVVHNSILNLKIVIELARAKSEMTAPL